MLLPVVDAPISQMNLLIYRPFQVNYLARPQSVRIA